MVELGLSFFELGFACVVKTVLDLANFGDFWDVVHEHILDSVFESFGGRRTSGACPLELQKDDAVFKAMIEHVASIGLDHGPDPGFQDLLDSDNDLVVVLCDGCVLALLGVQREHGLCRFEEIRDRRIGRVGDVGPVARIVLGDRDVIRREEKRADAIDREQGFRQRGSIGIERRVEIVRLPSCFLRKYLHKLVQRYINK